MNWESYLKSFDFVKKVIFLSVPPLSTDDLEAWSKRISQQWKIHRTLIDQSVKEVVKVQCSIEKYRGVRDVRPRGGMQLGADHSGRLWLAARRLHAPSHHFYGKSSFSRVMLLEIT